MKLHPNSISAIADIKRITGNDKKIVFVSGNFNIVHPGHLRLLRFAKECGDFLVVGLIGTESKGAILPSNLRLEGVKAISWVDYSFILDDEPSSFIEELKPAVVVKGKEHEDRFNPETKSVAKYGGKLLFGSGDIIFSSVDLIRNEWSELNLSTITKSIEFTKRHGFTFNDLLNIIDSFQKLNVCVIGDIIIDEYITCDALGMSHEDPSIVVMPVHKEKYIGGAAIVAAHARNLGADVQFFTIVGQDEISHFADEKMQEFGIQSKFYIDGSRPTTLKQRFRAENNTLLRVSHLRHHGINRDLCNKIFNDVISIIDGIDLMLFSDFNYGCLPTVLINQIITECSKRGIMMAADSQSSSQVGDISRFIDQSLLTPTEREARLAVHDFESGLVILAEKLRIKAKAKNVIVTLGEEGVLIHAETDEENKWLTDRLPAMNSAPKDVAGAGDSLLTVTSMAMALGNNIWKASYLGSLAAACQVGRLGNVPLAIGDLKAEILV